MRRAALAAGAASVVALGALLALGHGGALEPAPAPSSGASVSVGAGPYAVAWEDWTPADRATYCQAWTEEPELFASTLLPTFNEPPAVVEAFLAGECQR